MVTRVTVTVFGFASKIPAVVLGMPSNTVRAAFHDSKGCLLRVVKMPSKGVGDACYTP